jgi:phosphatidylglycerophosphate synthase
MLHSGSQNGRRLGQVAAASILPPLKEFAVWAFGGLAVLTLAGPVVLPQLPAAAWGLSAVLYLAGVAVVGDFLRRTYPHGSFGLCNAVTLARLVIVTALAASLFAGGTEAWQVVALATIALALDGIDGWLARRGGLVSAFGARFDMETDSAFALVLSLHALVTGMAGPVVLILGVMRYAFVAAAAILPWLNGPLPERFSRKAVCVLQIATLIVIQVPGMPSGMAAALVALASAALVWSFGRDIALLWRERP